MNCPREILYKYNQIYILFFLSKASTLCNARDEQRQNTEERASETANEEE